jgi:hypothetical protein
MKNRRNGIMRGTILLVGGGGQKLTERCVHRLHPLVPLVKVGWRQDRAQGSEEDQVMTGSLLKYATEERSWSFGPDLF